MPAALFFGLLGFLISTVAGQVTDDPACPKDFIRFGDSCYAYMQGKQSWAAAEQICVVLHSHLVEIFTADELSFVQNLSLANGNDDVWLGAHDLVREGHWAWAWSGSDLEITAWAPGQPDDGDNGREDCMELDDRTLLWNDEDCRHEKHYICQKSVNGETMIG